MACITLLAASQQTVPAQESRLRQPTKIRVLQAKYQAERAQVLKLGSAKRFVPILFDKAEEIAKRGEAALASGRLLQAHEAFRQARWQLPYESPQVPKQFVARIIATCGCGTGTRSIPSLQPDGRRLATASKDRTSNLGTRATAMELLTYTGQCRFRRRRRLHPDGKLIASAVGTRHQDLGRGHRQDVRTLKGPGLYSKSLAWSRGRQIRHRRPSRIARAKPGLVAIYDAASGEIKRLIADFNQPVPARPLSDDGAILSRGSATGQIRHWEFPKVAENPNQPEYWAQQDPTGATYHLAFSPDGRTLAGPARRPLRI